MTRLLRFSLLGVLLGAHAVVAAQGLAFRAFGERQQAWPLMVTGLFAVALVSTFWRRWRYIVGAGLSLAVSVLLFGWSAAWLVGIVGGTLVALRLPHRALRALVILLAWATWPAARYLDLARGSSLFGYLWASLILPALWLSYERDVPSVPASPWARATYLLPLTRITTPFIQPIRASHFFARETPELDPRRTLRGFALGSYGLALAVLMDHWEVWLPARLPELLRPPAAFVVIYLANAAWLFAAVGLFRLVGFDLDAGFRWPLLSPSLGDLVRRWNSHIYEAVRTLVFEPLAFRLRRVVPRSVAFLVAGYLAVAIASFALTNVVLPLLSAPSQVGSAILRFVIDPHRLWFHVTCYSLMLWPPLLGIRRPPAWAQRVILWVVLLTLFTAVAELGVPGFWVPAALP